MARIAGMPGPATGSAVPAGRARTLAQVYRHFGEVDAGGTSPLYERVAVALSESGEALRAIEAAPARKRHPTVILAALHDLALAGRAPALAAAYAAADGDAAAGAAIDTLLRMTGSVVAIAVRRRTRANETGRCAVLYPAIAEAARRAGANAVGLIDVGCSAGLNLHVDRVGITYSNGQSLGPLAAAGRRAACWRGWQTPSVPALPKLSPAADLAIAVAILAVNCEQTITGTTFDSVAIDTTGTYGIVIDNITGTATFSTTRYRAPVRRSLQPDHHVHHRRRRPGCRRRVLHRARHGAGKQGAGRRPLGGPHRRTRRRPERHRDDADPGRPQQAGADQVPHPRGVRRRAGEPAAQHAGPASRHVRRRRHRRHHRRPARPRR